MHLVLSKRFQRDLKYLLSRNPTLKPKVIKALQYMHVSPTHPSLRLHKLEGSSTWSVSVDMSIRIILHISDELYLLRIGTHEDVY